MAHIRKATLHHPTSAWHSTQIVRASQVTLLAALVVWNTFRMKAPENTVENGQSFSATIWHTTVSVTLYRSRSPHAQQVPQWSVVRLQIAELQRLAADRAGKRFCDSATISNTQHETYENRQDHPLGRLLQENQNILYKFLR